MYVAIFLQEFLLGFSHQNRKKVVQTFFTCEKHLIRFMRRNLQLEDDMSFIDCGRIRLSSGNVEFSSEILEVRVTQSHNQMWLLTSELGIAEE